MDWGNFFANLPFIAWFLLLLVVGVIGLALIFLFLLLRNKDIKLKNIEVAEKDRQEIYQNVGKNLLDNQCSTAHNFLKTISIDLYEAGKKLFFMSDKKDLFILEDISKLIESKLNYEVKNDLTRNHIIEKNDLDLSKYSEAKAIGYYRSVKASLYQYNNQLPEYDLPLIMNNISIEDYKKTFNEIYFSARKIAGGIND